MKPPVASYLRRGYTMSRRARISHKNNEHPITHWITELSLDKETIQKMLIYCGIHHTGLYAKRTRFYRMPNLDKEKEMKRFFKIYDTIPVTKKKCMNYFENFLQGKDIQKTEPQPVHSYKNGKVTYIPLSALKY